MRLQAFLTSELLPLFRDWLPEAEVTHLGLVRSAARQPGDYQINGFLSATFAPLGSQRTARAFLARLNDMNPPWLQEASVTGPGFVNLTLSDVWGLEVLSGMVEGVSGNEAPPAAPDVVVVDYSSPNVAKEMAVHHMRSTVIGDAVVRVLEHLGHKVIRANHIGDWGTQFGMLLAWLDESAPSVMSKTLAELESDYCAAKARYDTDERFAQRARRHVVQLHQGDPQSLHCWQQLVDVTVRRNQEIYDRLNVTLTEKDVFGESRYNVFLPEMVTDLLSRGIAAYKDGAVMVILEKYTNKLGEPMAVLLQKRDGAFLYAATDVACVRYRTQILKATRLLYYVDARQTQHLEQAWEIARRAGYLPAGVRIEHHAFGMMLGQDGRPFKTRSGKTPKLIDLIEDAQVRVEAYLQKRSNEFSEEERQTIAKATSINCIKYADLVRHRETDYRFSWDEVLALEGNSAPYLLYALVRAKMLLKRSKSEQILAVGGRPPLSHGVEHQILVQLLRWKEVLQQVAQEGLPHLLCRYLYDLSNHFSVFYEKCPIFSETDQKIQALRLFWVEKIVETLQLGLELLGLVPLERM